MAIFREQAPRLLKVKWPNAEMLAQELYTMFLSDEPFVADSGLEVFPSAPGVPPITINTNVTPNGTPVDPIVVRQVGPIVPNAPPPPGTIPLSPPTSTPPPNVPPVAGGSNAYVGQVAGQVGGSTYNCTLTGLAGLSFSAPVQMANLDVTDVLPPGILVQVVKAGAIYYGFPPVFLGPST